MNEATKRLAHKLYREWMKSTHAFIILPAKMNLQKTTGEKWIDAISQNSNKKTVGCHCYESEIPGILRMLKKLPKIAENVTVKSEYILMSSFLNVMIDRENISTEQAEGNHETELNKKPYDFDYQISEKNIIQEILNGMWDGEENKQVAFSVTTHSSSTPPPCLSCKGKGFFRCEHCEGSGREQYVDGYYANGEERIKTGQCSHCYGQGKITCETCYGTGKQLVHADSYQIIKRFEDRKTLLRYDCLSASWGWMSDIDNNIGWDDVWIYMDNDELETCIEKLYKNDKEIIIDKEEDDEFAGQILAEIGDRYKNLFEENKGMCHLNWENRLGKGQLGCSLVKHRAIPAISISFTDSIEQRERKIYIFEDVEEEGMICFIRDLPELSFIRSLFI